MTDKGEKATGFGPTLGPIVSGFTSPALGWRWSFWIALIFAGVSCIPIVFLSETNRKHLTTSRANLEETFTSQLTMTKSKSNRSWNETITRVFLRPLYLLVTEPIVSACSGYLGLCYAIYYMSFQAFPIIFVQLYDLSPGQCGLVQLTVASGCILTLPVYWVYNQIWLRRREMDDQLSTKLQKYNAAEYYRLPLACLGGPLFVISLFWLGWSARKEVSFVVPMLAGIPFGMGFMCTFISLLYVYLLLLCFGSASRILFISYIFGDRNYLTDAYKSYAASANAASSCFRSLLATVLPLATAPMFSHLGISGACSLLGCLSALMSVIPFVFIWKGKSLRSRSRLLQSVN